MRETPVEGIPQAVAALCEEWGLVVEQAAAMHGDNALVVFVRRGQSKCVVRLACRPELGAMLLERLDPTRTLHSLNVFDAAAQADALIRRLAIRAPSGLPQSTDYAHRFATELAGGTRDAEGPSPRASSTWRAVLRAPCSRQARTPWCFATSITETCSRDHTSHGSQSSPTRRRRR